MKPKKQMKRESLMMDGKAVPESSIFLDVLFNSSKTRRAEIKAWKERAWAARGPCRTYCS